MDLILPLANEYAEKNSSATDALLQEIHAFSQENHAEPHMISGPLQGNLLSMLSKMIKPKRILEIGSFTGYSAICLAKGLSSDGVLHTIELRKEDANIAQAYFDRSQHAHQIKLHVGNAMEFLPVLDEDWDLVFIDADGKNLRETNLVIRGRYTLYIALDGSDNRWRNRLVRYVGRPKYR